ncbi:hypothetical protein [Micromonospora sp. KC721]|uniref:hypothetical protein n=1 Tax=Micromonospora sp. KC721 TaxID=2530380 RepID=UPI001A9F3171|nr:hypothetical protein [Micromonospora sp. KC721]
MLYRLRGARLMRDIAFTTGSRVFVPVDHLHAVDQRAETQRQMKAPIVTAPDELRAQWRNLNITKLIATCADLQPDQGDAAIPAVAVALRSLARRHQHLSTEIANLDELLDPLVAAINPALLAVNGVGPDVTGQLLVNRVVLVRLRWDPRTRDHMQRRTREGMSKKEIIRCLKRCVARELYQLITANDLQLAA